MKTKYFNDAMIGNRQLVASYSDKGELLRLCYPSIDYRQYLDFFHTGVKINDSALIKLQEDINNMYHQYYIEDTNILVTEIKNTYFNLQIKQTDFVPIKENVLIKRYEFKNENTIDLEVNFLLHSQLLSDFNNAVSGKIFPYGLLQYTHDTTVAIFSKNFPVKDHQINDTERNIQTGRIQDKDYIGMSADSSLDYEIGILQPQQTKTLEILIKIQNNTEKYSLEQIQKEIENDQKLDIEKELRSTKKYWNKFIKDHSKIELKENSDYDKKIKKIYHRSILLYPLLTNEATGGIAAAMEIDEQKTQCGRYAYCWPRDAVFITKALDSIGMEKETEKFYKLFCKNTQSQNGMWEQRFYTDGRLAPCWGYQIDETASVIYGIFQHYQKTKEIKFLKENMKMMEKAIHFLQQYIEDLLEEKKQLHVSYDLWEMQEGIHLYSLASIFAAFNCMLETYQILEKEKTQNNNRLKQENTQKRKEELQKLQLRIKQYVIEKFYDDTQKSFIRGNQDNKMDISILGAITPFQMFLPTEKKIMNTVEKINLTLRTYTGGYQRFEQDHYRNGNPWPIATLWMALYNIEIKDYKKAKECLDFVVASANQHGYLAEQVDNTTMTTAWVIGLGWSHAMFLLVLEKLSKGDVS